MRKKLLSTLLALCMVLALLPGTALAEDYPTSGTCGENATWTYDDSTKTLTINGSGEITNFWGSAENNSYLLYKMKENVEKVRFSGDFTAIGDSAFWGFANLDEIAIPDSVTKLGPSAFSNCSKLAKVVIPAGVKELGSGYSGVFNNCPMLTSAGPIGSGCSIEFGWKNEIPGIAFVGCRYLTEIKIPEPITTIGYYAFRDCASLTSISIPASVIRINYDSLFEGCTSLKNISVDSKNKIYASQDGLLLDKESATLLVCPNGKDECTIPKSVKRIDWRAFQGCYNLVELVIPDAVISVSPYYYSSLSFEGCTSLKKLTLTGSITQWGKMYGPPNLTTAIVNEGTTSLSGTFSGVPKLTTVYLPATLKALGEDTFKNCSNLKAVYFAGTQAQWDTLVIGEGNQELSLVKPVCNTPVPAPSEVPSTPDTPDKPNTPDTPSTPDTPTTPAQLTATVSSGGLGKKVSIQVQSGHWLTIQTRRAGSISISSIQAPVASSGIATVSFSAPSGSVIQIWETATEMQFSNGIPTTTILSTVVKNL